RPNVRLTAHAPSRECRRALGWACDRHECGLGTHATRVPCAAFVPPLEADSMASRPLPQSPSDLCLIRLSAIGDTCHTVPVVRALASAWPTARIVWVI